MSTCLHCECDLTREDKNYLMIRSFLCIGMYAYEGYFSCHRLSDFLSERDLNNCFTVESFCASMKCQFPSWTTTFM